ncbi:MAG: AMP-binding protein [Candidatus Omnitrophota bacterium]
MPTLNQKFLEQCRQFPDREAFCLKILTGWRRYKYTDVAQHALKVAYWLRNQGLQKQDRVALLADNGPEWGIIYFGILLAGGVSVPLDPQANHDDTVIFIRDAHATFIFSENKLTHLLKERVDSSIRFVSLRRERNNPVSSFEEIANLAIAPDAPSLPDVAEDDTASILYTSGTTSNPKGVELTHKNFLSNFNGLNQLKICSGDDCFISVLPLFHAYAFMATLIFPLFLGAKIIYPRTMKSVELMQIMKESKVSIFVGVPELFAHIYKGIDENVKNLPVFLKALLNLLTNAGWNLKQKKNIDILKLIYFSVHDRFGGNLRYLVSGGARLDPQIALGLKRFGFDVLEGYGLTETAPVVSLTPALNPIIGSVGKPLDGVEVKIVHPDAEGAGEIIIRGPNLMKGYYQKKDETDKVIRDGWFYSGDLGKIDAQGCLYICGRLKEVIVLSSGKNVFPEEVEKYYGQSVYVKELAVLLTRENGVESLKAIIVPDFEFFRKNGMINILEKIKWDMDNASKKISAYKRIMGFAISKEELPKTRLGKIKRYQLPDIYHQLEKAATAQTSAHRPGSMTMILQSPVGKKVALYLAKELSVDRDIKMEDHLELDLGVDSLKRIELMAGLEKMFHIQLPTEAVFQLATVADVIAKINTTIFSDDSARYLDEDFQFSWREILSRPVAEDEFPQIDLEPDIINRSLSYAVKGLALGLLKTFFRLEIVGKENLPEHGPYLICCNHASYLDAFVVMAGIPNKIVTQSYFIGLKDIFEHPLISWAIRMARLIPIDPSAELIKAMRAATFTLNQGKIVCIFPEGQRSIDGDVKTFKKGIGILTKELNTRVIPVAISGTFEAWPRTEKFPKKHPIKIVFGPSMNFPESSSYIQIADRVREEVVKLRTQAYKNFPAGA